VSRAAPSFIPTWTAVGAVAAGTVGAAGSATSSSVSVRPGCWSINKEAERYVLRSKPYERSKESVMDEYGVLELPAPARTTDDTCHGRCPLCDSTIPKTQGWSDDRREIARGPGPGAKPIDPGGHVSLTPPTPVPADSEVARLQRVLEDVRFSLERGCWQAALGAARTALTATKHRQSSDTPPSPHTSRVGR
jgi:hypothetical protein